ncbi:glycerol acyltransferase [Rhodocyclus tenuis]|uniref:Glycerol acyltransferase n=1 Tax=Rhodocyclus gracilis TaxID=2929842 RepID=A0ABX0WI34_9RHOO|nr:1-acyl-sn-glycerol-3-phosphate acyltransferase [Rhodocyclus gracilis]NJA88492.1 glycerol acyltransferase [Rhodocyclus gracilis]
MLARLCALALRLLGWHAVFTPPPGPKSVVIVYPHTSNWDFPVGLLFRIRSGVFMHWAGKDTLFRWPLRRFFLRVGGVPINRREHTGMTSQLLAAFASKPEFHMVITPEGTRSYSDHWKSGFYRLALAAQVPLGLGFIDFGRRQVGIERWITLTGDQESDLALIRDYYAGKRALYPEKAGPIRFKS